MKHIISILFALLFTVSLCGCGKTEEAQPLRVYSFHGENEYFTVQNGVIVLDEEEETFDGGDLTWLDESLEDFSYFSAKFYVQNGAEQLSLLHNTVMDQTGGKVDVAGDLGWISGDLALSDEALEKLPDSLFLELELTDLSGQSHRWLQQLEVKQVNAAE